MKFLLVSGAVVGLMSISACGGKQTSTDTTREAQGAIGATFSGSVETKTFEKTLRSRELVNMGQGGHYEREPSFRFRVTKDTELEIVATSDDTDLMLMVSGPGLPFMNDDTYGLDPAVRTTFPPGVYNIHVGSWQGGASDVPYTLHLRNPEDAPLEGGGHGQRGHGGGDAPSADANMEATPALGTLVLGQLSAGQALAARLNPANSSSLGCYGFFDLAKPIAEIDPRQLGNNGARVVLSGQDPQGETVDTVLLGVDANGNMICNDDFSGLDAGFEVLGGDHAKMKIFAGSWNSDVIGREIAFALKITNIDANEFEVTTVESRFQSEPLFTAIKGHYRQSIAHLGQNCPGNVRNADVPDWKVNVPTGGASLTFRAQGSGDPVMMVRTPSGEVLCNDDGNDLNSIITIADGAAGEYKVWGGAWNEGQSGSTVLSLRQSLPVVAARTRRTGVEDFNEHTVKVTARAPKSVLGNQQVCDGAGVGFMDLERTSAAFENTTSGNLHLLVRATADFDTVMIARSSGGFFECTDDDVETDALSVIELAPGDQAFVWAGAYKEADARKEITLRYAFIDQNSEGAEAMAKRFFE